MEIKDLIEEYEGNRDQEIRGIFSSIFILQNKLQTIFDNADPYITIKQFMLLVMINLSSEKQTYTHLGELLGCSRQNIKKLVASLEKKGYVVVNPSVDDKRRFEVEMTKKAKEYFQEIATTHTQHLNLLFKDYSNEEISILYKTLTKLYTGIDKVEK